MHEVDVLVAGGGASGLCAAVHAARLHPGLRVALIERAGKAGQKILLTGNGRCNLSNRSAGIHPYHNQTFAAAALAKYGVEPTLAFFKSLGLLTRDDECGRIYPLSNRAASVLDCLRFEAQNLGVEIICSATVEKAEKTGGLFHCLCRLPDSAETVSAEYLILATGGSAYAKDFGSAGYALARGFGHTVTPLFPALTALDLGGGAAAQLKGVRVHAAVFAQEDGGPLLPLSRGEILFTDYGLSGIAAMDASRFFSERAAAGKTGGLCAVLDLMPDMSEEELALYLTDVAENNPVLARENLFAGILPGALSRHFCKALSLDIITDSSHVRSRSGMAAPARAIKQFPFDINGVRGFDFAQVTAGGADVSEFNPSSLQSCKVSKLYACGELLDVDGGCGGFNLQWAWSSGHVAGEHAASHRADHTAE